MMRIIHHGTKAKPVFRGTCSSCGCVFEEDADVLTIVSHQRTRRLTIRLARVSCPQCHAPAAMYPHAPEEPAHRCGVYR